MATTRGITDLDNFTLVHIFDHVPLTDLLNWCEASEAVDDKWKALIDGEILIHTTAVRLFISERAQVDYERFLFKGESIERSVYQDYRSLVLPNLNANAIELFQIRSKTHR